MKYNKKSGQTKDDWFFENKILPNVVNEIEENLKKRTLRMKELDENGKKIDKEIEELLKRREERLKQMNNDKNIKIEKLSEKITNPKEIIKTESKPILKPMKSETKTNYGNESSVLIKSGKIIMRDINYKNLIKRMKTEINTPKKDTQLCLVSLLKHNSDYDGKYQLMLQMFMKMSNGEVQKLNRYISIGINELDIKEINKYISILSKTKTRGLEGQYFTHTEDFNDFDVALSNKQYYKRHNISKYDYNDYDSSDSDVEYDSEDEDEHILNKAIYRKLSEIKIGHIDGEKSKESIKKEIKPKETKPKETKPKETKPTIKDGRLMKMISDLKGSKITIDSVFREDIKTNKKVIKGIKKGVDMEFNKMMKGRSVKL